MQRFFNNRFSILYAYLLISLISYAGVRVVFAVLATQQGADIGLVELTSIFILGIIYDLSFVFYIGLALALLLLLSPKHFFSNRVARYLSLTVFYGLLLSLAFSLVAEVVYWNEFSTRFNFIAVDYLIYRHEVTNNIYESYPVFIVFAGLFLVTTVLFLVFRRRITRGLKAPMSLGARAAHFAIWASVVALSFTFLGQAPRNTFANNFSKELASNGPYQFFAAFRNNELDFETFYAQGQNEQISEAVKSIVERPNSQFKNSAIFDITRNI